MKRVRISNSAVNSYGTRVLTSGVDLSQYEKNPVILYMHQRGTVVGYMKDIKVEGDDITGEPVFDEATDLSKQLKKQMEVGSVRMVSACLDILEMSEAPEMVIDGQTCPTVTKSRLFEVSIVDVGSNPDALVLMHEGKTLSLAGQGEHQLPLLAKGKKTITPINNNKEEMELTKIALALGLDEKSDEATVLETAGKLALAQKEVEALKAEKEALTLAAITKSVDTAIKEQRIDAGKKNQFIELGKQIGVESLQNVFDSMHPQVKLSSVLQRGGQNGKGEWKKLSDVPQDELLSLKANDPEMYHQLYKAEYGQDF